MNAQLDPAARERLRRTREQKGLSLRALAEASGVAYPHICNLENGVHQLSDEAFTRVCHALGLSWEAKVTLKRAK